MPMDTADPVDMITTVGGALLLLIVGILVYQAREEIAAVVKFLFNRYVHLRWPAVDAPPHILSSYKMEPEKTPDTVPVPVLVPEVVPPATPTDDDIIIWLAQVRKPGETAYRFSSNQIYELVKGRRNEVLKAIAALRNEVPEPETQERTVTVRDNGGPPREIPL
jgi:hypothetical protein